MDVCQSQDFANTMGGTIEHIQVINRLIKESPDFLDSSYAYVDSPEFILDIMLNYAVYVGRLIEDENFKQVEKSLNLMEDFLENGSKSVQDIVISYFLEMLCWYLATQKINTNILYQWMGPRLNKEMHSLELLIPDIMYDDKQ